MTTEGTARGRYQSSARADTAPAVSQCTEASRASEKAMAWMPAEAAVSAAPTVPECKMARPRLGPRLMPASTMSGRPPKPPCTATNAIMAGVARTASVGTSSSPSSLRSSATSRPPASSADIMALVPLRSPSGAAMVTSSPAATAA